MSYWRRLPTSWNWIAYAEHCFFHMINIQNTQDTSKHYTVHKHYPPLWSFFCRLPKESLLALWKFSSFYVHSYVLVVFLWSMCPHLLCLKHTLINFPWNDLWPWTHIWTMYKSTSNDIKPTRPPLTISLFLPSSIPRFYLCFSFSVFFSLLLFLSLLYFLLYFLRHSFCMQGYILTFGNMLQHTPFLMGTTLLTLPIIIPLFSLSASQMWWWQLSITTFSKTFSYFSSLMTTSMASIK